MLKHTLGFISIFNMYNTGKCPIWKGFPTSFQSLVVFQYKVLKTQDEADQLFVKDH